MDDVQCPYCKEYQEINHDDGSGYEEGKLHEQQCSDCDKYFVFTTSISFYYEAYEADCLNDKEHNLKPTITFPVECTRMACQDCSYERQPTDDEWKIVKKEQPNA